MRSSYPRGARGSRTISPSTSTVDSSGRASISLNFSPSWSFFAVHCRKPVPSLMMRNRMPPLDLLLCSHPLSLTRVESAFPARIFRITTMSVTPMHLPCRAGAIVEPALQRSENWSELKRSPIIARTEDYLRTRRYLNGGM